MWKSEKVSTNIDQSLRKDIFDLFFIFVENILGSEGTGAEVLVELLKSTRVQTSVFGVQLMKQLLNSLTKHCIETKTGGGHIM